jgi:hypothetical protein
MMKHTNNPKVILLLSLAIIVWTTASCAPRARVGELRSESQSVELGDASSVRVEINLGAGELQVTGGAQKLLEADFNYNVAVLKPEVEYSAGTLVVRQPDTEGLPVLRDITGFRNEWSLRLNDEVPMDLKVDVGAGTTDLQLAGLSLTSLDVSLGAGETKVDLTGSWANDLNVSIDAGAGSISLRLPKDAGVRVVVASGVGTVNASGLTKDGDVYTNDAFGVSDVTLQVTMSAGIGQINLDVE